MKTLLKYLLMVSALLSGIQQSLCQHTPCLRCVENPYSFEKTEDCCPYRINPDSALIPIIDLDRKKRYFHQVMRSIHTPSEASSYLHVRKVVNGYQKKPFILDSEINTPIAIQSPLGIGTIHILPRFKFRIFQNDIDFPFGIGDVSLPVRTPSAMPGVAYYFTRNNWWDQEDAPIWQKNKYLGLYVYHHSNGQDGIEFDTLQIGKINQYNGNFSEQIVFEFIIGGRFRPIPEVFNLGKKITTMPHLGKKKNVMINNEKEWFWRTSYEWHPLKLSNPDFSRIYLYPRHRINLQLLYIILPTKVKYIGDGNLWCMTRPQKKYEKYRFQLDLSYMVDRQFRPETFQPDRNVPFFNIKHRMNISSTFYYILGESQHSALFGQIGYFATDNYNIYFTDRYFVARVGFAFGFFNQPEN